MLEVVEEDEHPLVRDVRFERRLGPEGLRSCWQDKLVVADRGERDPPDAVRVRLGRARDGLKRKACLPRAGSAREGQEPYISVLDESTGADELLLTSQEWRRGDGQIRLVERAERWEVTHVGLIDAFRG